MRVGHYRPIAMLLALACAALVLASPMWAADPPLELHWKDLVPPVQAAPKLKPFFAGAAPMTDDGTPAPPPKPEGRWMSTPVAKAAQPAPIVAGLDGKSVRISGYVVPLDFDARTVKEFLLVPYMGACVHVPPPPANQIIYIKLDTGLDIDQTYDVVMVTGKLLASQTSTGLADAGYAIEGASAAPWKQP